MANFGKQFLGLVLVSLPQCDCAEERIDSSNVTLLLAKISEELGLKNQISILQNAIILFILLFLIAKKPFDFKLVSLSAMNFDLVVKTVVGAVLTLLFSVVFLPIYLILLIAKKVVELIVMCRFGKAAVKSTGTDIMWGLGTKSCQPFITAALKFDGYPDINVTKEHITKRVINFETQDGRRPFQKFKQVFRHYYGYFFWKDCYQFDIDNHIKIVNLTKLYPNLNDTEIENCYLASTDHLLCRYVSDFGFQVLPANQPQWEINLLTKENENSFIMYIKLHHAIGDGVSLLRLLLEHIIDSPVKMNVLHKTQPHPFKKFLYSLWSLTFIPFTMKYLLLDRTPNPLHGQKLSGNKILVASDPISLGLIKAIKDETETTVIDVLLSCISFAVANHFQRKSSRVEKINMFFPIGVEDANAPISMCNKFTVGITSLLTLTDDEMQDTFKKPTSEGPAVQRLFKTKNTLDEIRRSPVVLAMYHLSSTVIGVLPFSLAKRFFTSNGLTLAFSNVPGPQHDIYSMENKLTEMRFWVPDREPNGCGMSVMSYNGQMWLGISVDSALIGSRKEAEMIVDDFGLQLFKLSQELNL